MVVRMTDWKALYELSEKHNQELLEDLAQMENYLRDQVQKNQELKQKLEALTSVQHYVGEEPWGNCGDGYEAAVRNQMSGAWTQGEFAEWLDEHCMICPYFADGCYCCYGDDM